MQSRLGLIAFVGVGIVVGCGASGSGGTTFDPGLCDGGDCADAPASATPTGRFDAGPPVCGDGSCNGSETCRTCPRDCGECPACSLAPSCTNALGIPSHPSTRFDLDQGVDADAGPDSGPPSTAGADLCEDAELRIRIAQVLTHKGGGEIYCVIDGTDGATSEVAITPKTKSLGSGETAYFDPSAAVFWGQKALHPTTNNLTITYNCFVVKSDAWAKVLGAMGDASKGAGSVAGPYGWAFGIGSVAADAAAAAVQAASGDTLLFNAQQTIDKGELLDLTNGRVWNIRKSGGGLFDSWDWEIQVESWGCADGIAKPK